jgi:hypothetical protein
VAIRASVPEKWDGSLSPRAVDCMEEKRSRVEKINRLEKEKKEEAAEAAILSVMAREMEQERRVEGDVFIRKKGRGIIWANKVSKGGGGYEMPAVAGFVSSVSEKVVDAYKALSRWSGSRTSRLAEAGRAPGARAGLSFSASGSIHDQTTEHESSWVESVEGHLILC